MEAMQAGDFPMKASRWPSGFYEDGIYDPKDKTIGLFRNHTVVRVRFPLSTDIRVVSYFFGSSINTYFSVHQQSPTSRLQVKARQNHPRTAHGAWVQSTGTSSLMFTLSCIFNTFLLRHR